MSNQNKTLGPGVAAPDFAAPSAPGERDRPAPVPAPNLHAFGVTR